MSVVYSLEQVDTVRADFEAIGYEYLGEFGICKRRYLRKGGDFRTHQIHIFSREQTQEIRRHLAFRDYLRTHTDVCRAYADLKKELAKKYPCDIEGYCNGKDGFVKYYETAALLWKQAADEKSKPQRK